jgi:hypothetical protein
MLVSPLHVSVRPRFHHQGVLSVDNVRPPNGPEHFVNVPKHVAVLLTPDLNIFFTICKVGFINYFLAHIIIQRRRL